jgi:hypothetical protein
VNLTRNSVPHWPGEARYAHNGPPVQRDPLSHSGYLRRCVQERKNMIKAIIVSAFLSFAVVFSSYAQDSDRIVQLEKEIQELRLRVSKLESLLNNPSKAQDLVTSGEGWKSVANWRKLTTDMSAGDVRQVLGEPDRLDGGNVAYWHYKNGGRVIFISGKVNQWREP